MQGDKDDVVDPEDTKEYADRIRARWKVFEGTDHRYKRPGELEQIVKTTERFLLEKHFYIRKKGRIDEEILQSKILPLYYECLKNLEGSRVPEPAGRIWYQLREGAELMSSVRGYSAFVESLKEESIESFHPDKSFIYYHTLCSYVLRCKKEMLPVEKNELEELKKLILKLGILLLDKEDLVDILTGDKYEIDLNTIPGGHQDSYEYVMYKSVRSDEG